MIPVPAKILIHIRISEQLDAELEDLVGQGLFSHKNEVIRSAIRHILLKYREGKDE